METLLPYIFVTLGLFGTYVAAKLAEHTNKNEPLTRSEIIAALCILANEDMAKA